MIETIERPAETLEPTPIRSGSWHIIWWIDPCVGVAGLMRPIGEGLWLDLRPWPSREIAEQKAQDDHAKAVLQHPIWMLLICFERVEFMPEGA